MYFCNKQNECVSLFFTDFRNYLKTTLRLYYKNLQSFLFTTKIIYLPIYKFELYAFVTKSLGNALSGASFLM